MTQSQPPSLRSLAATPFGKSKPERLSKGRRRMTRLFVLGAMLPFLASCGKPYAPVRSVPTPRRRARRGACRALRYDGSGPGDEHRLSARIERRTPPAERLRGSHGRRCPMAFRRASASRRTAKSASGPVAEEVAIRYIGRHGVDYATRSPARSGRRRTSTEGGIRRLSVARQVGA